MNNNSINQQITQLLEQELNLTVPAVTTDLFETGIMDSLVFVDLLLLLERSFQINIDMEQIEIEDFKSVETISVFVIRNLQTVNPAGRDVPQLALAL